jgi:ABC-type lipoprotein export system ATPase subunit
MFFQKAQPAVGTDAPSPGDQHGPGRTYVLRRITLDIKEGEFVSIMGPSGAGKSTVLHILGMHDSAWTGEYSFMGVPVHALGKKERAELHKKHFGFVFQSYHLLDNLTVYENLEIPLSYRDIKRSARESQIMELFKRLNAEGTTIVQVTHSDTNAAYGDRVVRLRDGWIVEE